MKLPSTLWMRRACGIYCIENVLNSKKYIGSSVNIYQRLAEHKTYLNKGKHHSLHLQRSWLKNGESSFTCHVIELCAEDILREREQHWFDTLKPAYNICKDAVRNTPEKETRVKIAVTLKRKYKSGEIQPTRQRRIRSFDLEGNPLDIYSSISEAARQLKVANTSIERCLAKTYKQVKGKQFCYEEETTSIGKIIVRKGTPLKSIIVTDLETGALLTFNSLEDFYKKLSIPKYTYRHLQGKTFHSRYFVVPAKLGELLETPVEANQQPNLSRNTLGGSTTNSIPQEL